MTKHPYVLFLCTLLSLWVLPSMAANINGRVWTDANNNGIQDAGETGRAGVIVRVLDAASRQQRGVAGTNSTGSYSVEGLAAGTYIVHITNPGGVWSVKKDQGSNDAADSDVDELGFSDAITLSASGSATIDAGFSTRPQGCFTPVTLTATAPVCNNNNTPNNPSDDTFTFSITATGGTGPWGFDYGARKMLPYGQAASVGPFPISGGAVTININDHDNPDCVASIRVSPPAPCSTPSVITMRCAGDVVVTAAAGATTAVATFPLPTVSTTCPGGRTTVTRVSGPASGSAFPVGETLVCFRVTDECGGQQDCCIKVIVRASAASIVNMNCVSPAAVTAAPGATTAVVNYTTPTATSTCTTGSTTVTRISGPASGSAFPVGTTQVCFQATDGCGQTTSCCITVTVNRSTSAITFTCTQNITVSAGPSSTSAVVNYTAPTATSTCTTGSTTVTRISGPASGSAFPVGTTQVCYQATDGCGQTASCCFNVTVNAAPEPTPCEVRTVGCAKFEMLSVRRNGAGDLVYRVRITNNCSDALAYVALEIPQGARATAPAGGSVYTAPSGRQYTVRNPSATPFSSVRFMPVGGGIAAGQSEVFEYTVKSVTQDWYIKAMMCVMPGAQYQAILQMNNCMVAPRAANTTDNTLNPTAAILDEVKEKTAEVGTPAVERGLELGGEFIVYPNPTTGILMANLSKWDGQKVTVQVLNSVGQQVRFMNALGGAEPIQIDMTRDLSNGIYYLQVVPPQGIRETQRFVLQR